MKNNTLTQESLSTGPRDDAMVQGQLRTLELIATGAPLAETLDTLLRAIESSAPEMLCSVLLLDPDSIHLRHGAGPSLHADYMHAINGSPIGASAGSCGTAVFRRAPVFVGDIASDPLWADYADLALGHGLRACWSTPIVDAQQNVLGSFAIYYREPRTPSAAHQRLIDIATHIASVAICRERDVLAKRVSENRYRRLVESNLIGIIIADLTGCIKEANDVFLTLLGRTRDDVKAGLLWDDITPPKWAAVDRAVVEQLGRSGVASAFEKEYWHKDGHPVPVLVHVALLDAEPVEYVCLVQDLTEAKLATETLTSEIARRHLLLDHAHDGIFVVDERFHVVEANRSFLELLGADGGDTTSLVPWDWDDVYDTEERFRAQWPRLPAENVDFESRIRRRDGSVRNVEFSGSPSPTGEHGGQQMLFICRDVTERKRADRDLRESQARMQLLLRASNLGFWDWDLVTREVFMSPEFVADLGHTDDAAWSPFSTWEGRLHPDDRTLTLAAASDYIEGRRADFDVEFRLRHGNGSWRWVLARADLVRDKSGAPVRMMGCFIDVTDKHNREEERRHVFERITDAFVALDRNWCYTFVNARAGEMLGRDPSSLIGKHIWTEFPEGIGQPFHAVYEQAMRDQRPAMLQEHYPPYDRWFENRVYPSPDGLTIYFHDITDQKRAEAEIRQLNAELEARVLDRTMKLEAANKELEAFSYSVSHDLRAPLRAVTGFAQILARRHRAALNDEGQRYADNIVMAGERMATLIDDLLNYSKLGRRSIRLQPVSLMEVLSQTAANGGDRFHEAGGLLEIAPDLPTVHGDRTLLGQVFGNLIQNALTYHSPGTPPRVRVSWEREGARVLVHVSDDGIGISPDHHKKIFNVFQRLHSDEEFPGTGIGLAIVQKALLLIGGEIGVKSERGVGSVFTVSLPAQATA